MQDDNIFKKQNEVVGKVEILESNLRHDVIRLMKSEDFAKENTPSKLLQSQ